MLEPFCYNGARFEPGAPRTGARREVRMATSASQVSLVVEGFLRELLGAKKAVKLYPAGNPLATEWIQRLHRSLDAALKEGLPSELRIEPGGFAWDGGQLVTRDQALESFRFDLETRRITELALAPGVEAWELQHFLDCLNLRHEDVEAAGGLSALLAQRSVVHITVHGPLWGDGAGSQRPGATASTMDVLESLVGVIVEALADRFRELTYDRVRLSGWFDELARPGDRAEAVFRAILMLAPLVESEPDREIRYRTITECLMALPGPLRTAVVTGWLMPAVRTELHVLNLLTRFSGDEFAELVGLLPAASLEDLRAEIEALPAEEWKKARIVESLEDALAEKEVAVAPIEPLIDDDDPGLVALREAARLGCTAELALAHSVNVLFYVIGEAESEGYPALLVDALEESVTEALARGQLAEALRIVRWLFQPAELRPEWQAEHQRRLHLLQRRLSARSQVMPLADLLRRREEPADVAAAAEYLRILGPEAMSEFLEIFADEPEAGPRTRMLDVLAAIGPTAAPALRARVTDPRWQLVRSALGLLVRFGDRAAYATVEKVARHEHPQVRREAARTLAALGGREALPHLFDCLVDPDGEVRVTAIKLLGGLVDATTVAALRDFLSTPTRSAADLVVKREILTALAALGSQEARAVVEAIAQRRVWPWQRNELTIRDLAGEALKSMVEPAAKRES